MRIEKALNFELIKTIWGNDSIGNYPVAPNSPSQEDLFFENVEPDKDGDVVIVNNTGEKFDDVYNEMIKNVPDMTSTIEEKNLAISYIDRMLACSDISDDLKVYWQNKKSIIEQEIIRAQNDNKVNSQENENVLDVWDEFEKFVAEYGKDINNGLSEKDRKEYYNTYFSTVLSYYNRLLSCEDLTPELKLQYQIKINEIKLDKANATGQPEKFDNVYEEMSQNVPEQTSTIEEKNLAISYIDRMLACSDISDDLKVYWQNKKNTIEQEIKNIQNQDSKTGIKEIRILNFRIPLPFK